MSMQTWYGTGAAFSMGYNPTCNYWAYCPKNGRGYCESSIWPAGWAILPASVKLMD